MRQKENPYPARSRITTDHSGICALVCLRVFLGHVGEHGCAAVLHRLKALSARLLKQQLWLRPIVG